MYTFEENYLHCSTFLDMERRLREPRLGWRGECLPTAMAVASVLPRRVDGANVPAAARAGQRHALVAEAAGEGGGGVVNHAEKVVGELVQAEVDVAAVVVVGATAAHG